MDESSAGAALGKLFATLGALLIGLGILIVLQSCLSGDEIPSRSGVFLIITGSIGLATSALMAIFRPSNSSAFVIGVLVVLVMLWLLLTWLASVRP